MLAHPHTKYAPFNAVQLKDRTWPDQRITQAPRWLSSDLRDGNQALIEPMTIDKKLRLFDLLVDIGFKEIEVAFPSASEIEFNFVRRLIEENRVPEDVSLQVLTQIRQDLIERSFLSLRGSRRAIMHIYNATAPAFRETVFGMSKEEIKGLAVKGAEMVLAESKKYPETEWTFQYSPEIFSATESEFALEVCNAVLDVWKPTPAKKVILNLPATVEVATPNIYADQIEWFCRHLSRRDSVIISLHAHNDRGCAVAATELALMAGADRVEGCLFGNGERTGNVDLVTLALNLYTQGIHPNLSLTKINKIVHEVEHCTQLPVHPRHPYAGELVFTAFSGSHQDAIRKGLSKRKNQPDNIWTVPYLPIDPKDLDRSYEAVIRVNSQSGKGGIVYLLEQDYGLELPRRLQIEFSRVVQKIADQTAKELNSQSIYTIFEAEYLTLKNTVELTHQVLQYDADKDSADIEVTFNYAGKNTHHTHKGNGPISALVGAINAVYNVDVDVIDYHEHARSKGADATAVAYVEMQIGEKTLFGVGCHANITKASLLAVMSAFNRALSQELVVIKL